MKKVNQVLYHKLLLQAEEGRDQGLHKLASGIFEAIGPLPEDEKVSYSHKELEQDIYSELWKVASLILKYYDVESVDAQKMHERLESLTKKALNEVCTVIDKNKEEFGPLEPEVLGQSLKKL